MAEISRRWSPYNYVENDPIRLTDPDGMYRENSSEIAEDEARWAVNQTTIEDGKAGIVHPISGGGTKQSKKDKQAPTSNNDVTKLSFWTDWNGWLNATPVLGEASRAGRDLKNGNYGNAALGEGSAILEALMFVPGRAADIALGSWNTMMGLFARDAASDVTSTACSAFTKEAQIFSAQPAVEKEKVEMFLQKMRDGSFDATKGAAGFFNKGKTIITDGNNRIVAAINYGLETGNYNIFKALIRNGNFQEGAPAMWGSKIYKLGGK